MAKGLVMLAAGGTGGHLFPAEALAHALIGRGYDVHLVTDSRAERFAGTFPASRIHVVPSATMSSKNPIAVIRTLMTLWKGTQAAKRLMKELKPAMVVGFGGYPTLPPLMAASSLGIPTMIHEQNAVMGRANKLLAGRVRAIAGGFLPEGHGAFAGKTVTTGNPVRPAVLEAAGQAYQPSGPNDPFNLVVFGGSQGAQYFSTALPAAIGLLDERQKGRLRVTQQARPEDGDSVVAAYRSLGAAAEVSPFFTDMARRIAGAHLVICRSGASTVSEISVIGRPSILVPYPHALDHDQAANAAALMAQGGAQVIAQGELSREKLASLIGGAMNDPDGLGRIAAAARLAGKPDAAILLADMVEAIASGQSIQEFKARACRIQAGPME
jgi:UDP-N-acetylglucosamine--N-acetylmuramyl-(pentapeptide) pyrophosphoryl-undecaprenol N-acetylglucosamine transferase